MDGLAERGQRRSGRQGSLFGFGLKVQLVRLHQAVEDQRPRRRDETKRHSERRSPDLRVARHDDRVPVSKVDAAGRK